MDPFYKLPLQYSISNANILSTPDPAFKFEGKCNLYFDPSGILRYSCTSQPKPNDPKPTYANVTRNGLEPDYSGIDYRLQYKRLQLNPLNDSFQAEILTEEELQHKKELARTIAKLVE